jgi:hypothetical protein
MMAYPPASTAVHRIVIGAALRYAAGKYADISLYR